MGCLHVELCVRQGSKEVSYISPYWSEIRMSLVVGRGSLRNSNRADGGRRPGLYVEYGTALAIAPPGRRYVCWHRQHLQVLWKFWSEILCVSAILTSRKRFFIRSSFLTLLLVTTCPVSDTPVRYEPEGCPWPSKRTHRGWSCPSRHQEKAAPRSQLTNWVSPAA